MCSTGHPILVGVTAGEAAIELEGKTDQEHVDAMMRK